MINENLIEFTHKLTVTERREVLARLLTEQTAEEIGTVWKSLRFSKNLRVLAYAPEQEKFVDEARQLLLQGVLVRIENQADGTCEIYGKERTFYATISEKKEFVALLSSWLATEPPREINLAEVS